MPRSSRRSLSCVPDHKINHGPPGERARLVQRHAPPSPGFVVDELRGHLGLPDRRQSAPRHTAPRNAKQPLRLFGEVRDAFALVSEVRRARLRSRVLLVQPLWPRPHGGALVPGPWLLPAMPRPPYDGARECVDTLRAAARAHTTVGALVADSHPRAAGLPSRPRDRDPHRGRARHRGLVSREGKDLRHRRRPDRDGERDPEVRG